MTESEAGREQTCDSCGRTGTRGFRRDVMGYVVCVARQGACNKRVHKRFGHWLPDLPAPARKAST